MDLVSPIIDIVKTVGEPGWKYLKAQIRFHDRLNHCNRIRGKLSQLHESIRSRLDTELQTSRSIPRNDVETWLSAADQEMSRRSVEDEVSQGGCLSCFCRTRILEKRTRELRRVYKKGEKYTLENSLVVDDYRRILDDDMATFQGWKKKLQGKYEDVMATLDSQLCFMKVKKKQVENWLAEVEKLTGLVAKDVEDQVSSENSSQYAFLTTLLRGKIEEMKELYNEGGRLPEILVMDDPSTSAPELPTTKLEGSNVAKEKILRCLMGEEETKLGVWGMGGVGKTTVMEHVYNQLLKESKFKKVILITVSQTFDVYRIQQQIASILEENLPEHHNIRIRAAMLMKMLEVRKPYAMILDDVWEVLELTDVGIPEPLAGDGCKLVLTTRSDEVVRQMHCKEIKVETLSQEASVKLFLEEVGDAAYSKHGGIRENLEQIVYECGGLPLAVKTVAGSMKGINDPRLWRTALNQLKHGRRNVAGTEDDKFHVLKFSYDWLKDPKIQSVFLHCAMYPEDYIIQKGELIEFWIDEEVIGTMETRQAMIDEGYAILKKLEENCLLESAKNYGGGCVKMHDLVRDMAIHILRSSSPRYLVKAGVGLTEIPEEDEWEADLLKVSLMWNRIEEIPPSMSSPKCPMLTTLLLSGEHHKFSTIPEAFFEHMPELKVLDLSYNAMLISLPSSISKLVKLTTLKLVNCSSLKTVPSLSNLRVLKKLDLVWSGIEEIPQGLEMLLNLKYLKMPIGTKIVFSEVLSNLSKLQYLCVFSKMWLKGEVLESLSKLETFVAHFSAIRDMNIFFETKRKNLQRYTMNIGRWSLKVFDLNVVRRISLDAIDICGEPNLLPSDVQGLMICSCNDVKTMNDVSGFQDVKGLQKCWVNKCKGMEYLFSDLDGLEEVDELKLLDLEDLKGLFEVELALDKKFGSAPGVFSSLERINIRNCPEIKTLLPAKLHFHNLKEIEVSSCRKMEEILVVSSSEKIEAAGISSKVILPKLQRLKLNDLPMLRCICSSTVALVCDSLENVSIEGCPNLDMEGLFHSRFNPLQTLKRFSLRGVGNLISVFDEETATSLSLRTHAHPPATGSFPLEELLVAKCPQLKKIFPSARLLLGFFQNLMEIRVEECDELEEIISSSPLEEGTMKITPLPKLERLFLTNLPKLKKVCSSISGLLISDSFKFLSIINCNELKRIPLHLPQSDNGRLSPPTTLRRIEVSTNESWESLDWDQPDAKNVLSPFCEFRDE